MSSVASQRVLLLALGSVSIAALFMWYIQSKKSPGKKQKRANESRPNVHNGLISKSMVRGTADPDDSVKRERNVASEKITAITSEQAVSSLQTGINDSIVDNCVVTSTEEQKATKEDEKQSADLSDADSQNAVSSGERSVSEGDYDIDEPVVCEKTGELILDVSHQADNETFSWSEEMERNYMESLKQEEDNREAGYDQSESPGLASQNSEVSSQDSGRATGGLASSLSPMDETGDALPMYEFEIPNSLVGLIIGIKGKTIKELSVRTDVRMLIRQHHTTEKVDSHQICQVRGKRDQINRCLQMLRRRFPPARFPELNLQPVLPPPLPNNLFDAVNAQPSWLTLPDGIPCEVVCSSVIDPGHFFLQQPTHPSYSSLSHLDMYMLRLYSQSQNGQIPELPKPCQNGLLCAAPVLGAWFRAVTVCYYADPDEVLVRFVDYGGYTRLPRSDLRQIRTDLMSLPFQATECYLAHVQPVDGTWQWGEAAMTHFQKLCMGKVINVTVVGYHVDDKVPMVELTVNDEDDKIVRLDRVLMDAGYAKAGDPSKLHKVQYTKRPNSISQTHMAV